MNVKLHAALKEFINCYRLFAPLFICMALASFEVTILVCLPAIIAMLLTWLVPVECTRLSCTGRMRVATERLSTWRVGLLYRCDNCGTVHREEIFDPNIEITFEFSG